MGLDIEVMIVYGMTFENNEEVNEYVGDRQISEDKEEYDWMHGPRLYDRITIVLSGHRTVILDKLPTSGWHEDKQGYFWVMYDWNRKFDVYRGRDANPFTFELPNVGEQQGLLLEALKSIDPLISEGFGKTRMGFMMVKRCDS